MTQTNPTSPAGSSRPPTKAVRSSATEHSLADNQRPTKKEEKVPNVPMIGKNNMEHIVVYKPHITHNTIQHLDNSNIQSDRAVGIVIVFISPRM